MASSKYILIRNLQSRDMILYILIRYGDNDPRYSITSPICPHYQKKQQSPLQYDNLWKDATQWGSSASLDFWANHKSCDNLAVLISEFTGDYINGDYYYNEDTDINLYDLFALLLDKINLTYINLKYEELTRAMRESIRYSSQLSDQKYKKIIDDYFCSKEN